MHCRTHRTQEARDYSMAVQLREEELQQLSLKVRTHLLLGRSVAGSRACSLMLRAASGAVGQPLFVLYPTQPC